MYLLSVTAENVGYAEEVFVFKCILFKNTFSHDNASASGAPARSASARSKTRLIPG